MSNSTTHLLLIFPSFFATLQALHSYVNTNFPEYYFYNGDIWTSLCAFELAQVNDRVCLISEYYNLCIGRHNIHETTEINDVLRPIKLIGKLQQECKFRIKRAQCNDVTCNKKKDNLTAFGKISKVRINNLFMLCSFI